MDTSKLSHGNGIATFVDSAGRNFGYESYKNNHLDGNFYFIDTSREHALKGVLRYSPHCVKHWPGVKVTYLSEGNDTLTMTLDSSMFNELFIKYPHSKIIGTQFAMAPEMVSGAHPDLLIGLSDDPAIVPIARWQRIDLKKKFVLTQFDFDDCGNAITITYFNPDGSVLQKNAFKRKKIKKKFW